MSGLPTVITYALLSGLWGAILVLYLRHRRTAKARDPLVAMLLGVLALDAFKSVVESTYFGLLWGAQYGALDHVFDALSRPWPLTAVKWLNVVVAILVLTRLVRQWVPDELAARERHRLEEAALRKQLEESLRVAQENEERFRLAADAGQQGMWDYDLRSGIFWPSRGYRALLGLREDDPSFSRGNWDLMHPEDAALIRERLATLRPDETRYVLRYRMKHADGSWRLLRGEGLVLRDAAGTPVRVLGFSRDITAETAAEEALRQTQKLESLGLLAGGVAHDFNNLLTVIVTNLSMLEESARPEDMESISNSLLAARRAAGLTHQLLAYGGKATLSKKPVDLSALVSEIAQLLRTATPPKVQIVERLERPLPAVSADAVQLQQVVMNLVTNAAEAIGSGAGTVVVQTAAVQLDEKAAREADPGGSLQPGTHVTLTVTDTGSGMSKETLSRIFDPFFTTKATGRGLGLSAMAGILRAHGGAVQVSSEPGKGSVFRVFLPASPAPVEAASAPAPARVKLSGRVLLVEDEALLRKGAARMLRNFGVEVVEAANGREAVELIAKTPHGFDAVLMDLMMPVMGGLEALSRIRELRPDLPVVLTSGYSATPVEPQPWTTFLPKPFDGAQVANALRQTGAIG